LDSGVEVAQPPLQWRGLIERAATAYCEARIGGANAGGREPYRSLSALREEYLVLQRSGKRVTPVTCCLALEKRPRCPQFGRDAAKFALEWFRVSHRHSGLQLLPTGIGKLNQ
jgi:hypothetical protein